MIDVPMRRFEKRRDYIKRVVEELPSGTVFTANQIAECVEKASKNWSVNATSIEMMLRGMSDDIEIVLKDEHHSIYRRKAHVD